MRYQDDEKPDKRDDLPEVENPAKGTDLTYVLVYYVSVNFVVLPFYPVFCVCLYTFWVPYPIFVLKTRPGKQIFCGTKLVYLVIP